MSKKTNSTTHTTLKQIAKIQIKMYNKAKAKAKPRQKDINKLILSVNHYVDNLNVPEDEKSELLEVLSTHYLAEVLSALDESL